MTSPHSRLFATVRSEPDTVGVWGRGGVACSVNFETLPFRQQYDFSEPLFTGKDHCCSACSLTTQGPHPRHVFIAISARAALNPLCPCPCPLPLPSLRSILAVLGSIGFHSCNRTGALAARPAASLGLCELPLHTLLPLCVVVY